MSGTAAVVGIVASGAGLLSLGIQLGEAAVKLKKLYDKVSNAPRTIQRLTFSLQTMSMALQRLEEYRQHDKPTEALLLRCILQCQQSTNEIERIVAKIERRIYHGKVRRGLMYAVYKDAELHDLMDDLEHAKSTLELAYMIYVAEEQKLRDENRVASLNMHAVALDSLQTLVAAGQNNVLNQLTYLAQIAPKMPHQQHPRVRIRDSSSVSVIEANTVQRGRSVDRSRKRHLCRLWFRLPAWISSKIWEFNLEKAQNGFDLHLRTCNLGDGSSIIWYYCAYGYVEQVRRLVSNGEASPLEVRPNDTYKDRWYTLLEVRQSLCMNRYLY